MPDVFEEKNLIFSAYVTPRVPMDSLKIFQPMIGPAVWLAIANTCSYKYIYVYISKELYYIDLNFFSVFFCYELEKSGWRREVHSN